MPRSPTTWLEASVSCKTSRGLRIGNNLRGVLESTTSSQIWKGIIFNTAWPQQRSDLHRSFSFSLQNVHTNHPPFELRFDLFFPGIWLAFQRCIGSSWNLTENWLSFLVFFSFLFHEQKHHLKYTHAFSSHLENAARFIIILCTDSLPYLETRSKTYLCRPWRESSTNYMLTNEKQNQVQSGVKVFAD